MDVSEQLGRAVVYRCVVGHSIAQDELDDATEVKVLDGGAELRLCREHGAPISKHIGKKREE